MPDVAPSSPKSAPGTTASAPSSDGPPVGVRGGVFDRLIGVSSWMQARALVYIGAATATVVGIWKLFGLKETGFGPSDWQFWVVVVVAVLPVLVAFFVYILPDNITQRRRRRLADWSVKGDAERPGHFQLGPRSEEDRDTFNRDDKAHDRALAWVRKCPSPVLYLTGVSGSGKSSILAAHVVPNLRADTLVVPLRASDDPLRRLREALLTPDAVWKADTAKKHEADDLSTLLKAATDHLAGKKRQLLIVFDQFEEILVLHSAGATTELAAILDVLQSIAGRKYGSCRLLLALRIEFIDDLSRIQLPAFAEDNHLTIEAFNEGAARKFLAAGFDQLGPDLLDGVIAEAAALDNLVGRIRPITLNMVGQMLRRMPVLSGRVTVGERLFAAHIRRLLLENDIKDHASAILNQLIDDRNRRIQKTVQELAGPQRDIHVVNGCLGRLALEDRGLVRCLTPHESDTPARRWEVSHDFVASVLGNVLPGLKPSIWKRLRPLLAPVALVLWATTLFLALPYEQKRRQDELNAQQEKLIADRNELIAQLSSDFGIRITNGDGDGPFSLRLSPEQKLKTTAGFAPLLKKLGNVVSLDMSGCNLVANVDDLADLSTLQTLNLSATSVKSVEGLKNLTALQTLDLSHTTVKSVEDLKFLSTLQSLNVSFTNVTVVKGLPALQSLNLGSCTTLTSVEGLILPNLQSLNLGSCQTLTSVDGINLPALQSLNLSNCQKLTSVDGLKNLPTLQTLNLSNCQKLTSVDGLKNLPTLQTLNLRQTGVKSVDGLKDLRALQTLDLSSTNVTSVNDLKNLPALQSLDLSNCQAMTSVDGLKDLPALKTLNLRSTNVTSVSGQRSLQTLDLSHTRVKNVDGLKDLPALQTLVLTRCQNLMNVDSLKDLHALQTLNLNFTGVSSVDSLKGLRALQTLDLSNCYSLTSVEVLKDLPALQTLIINFTNVTSVKGLLALHALSLAGCSFSSVDGLKDLPALQTLVLAECGMLMNVDGLKGLPALQTLNLANCHKLTNIEGLKDLSTLQTLDLIGCGPLTGEEVLKSRPNLKIIR